VDEEFELLCVAAATTTATATTAATSTFYCLYTRNLHLYRVYLGCFDTPVHS